MTPLRDRVAGAPITWGVCEVPGWGVQLPADRVLRELAAIGLTATELGPDGYLATEPAAIRDLLDGYGLRLVAGFVPAVLHDPDRLDTELKAVDRQAATLAGAGADLLVLAAATGSDGYEASEDLDDAAWRHLAAGIEQVEEVTARHGLVTALHPHYGTVVERADQVDQILDRSDVGLCLDAGHLMVAGADPVAITRSWLDRVRHVHLKDVAADLARQVRAGQITYHRAVADGLYRVLGEGDVDIAAMLELLEESGYRGWYVLEQDTVLDAVPPEPGGPAVDAAASLAYLEQISAA